MQSRGYFLRRSSRPWALYKRSRRLNALKTIAQLIFTQNSLGVEEMTAWFRQE